ncbi:MAG: ATPase [Candidatus Parabeggiatoa sp. nov. 3]|nr:MAG: ATPase [Gammaproteobacteria bacterium]RKZ59143.1 MAG: ATPase [Gammaproteobacteria bacterium]RKZ83172.1 MAG: ATPase [Gammaproteobacteria bacterium]
MLKRIYINNFRCLVNFELTVDTLNLYLGANGTGKTSIFEVLLKIQKLIVANQDVIELFEPADLTRWQDAVIQNFELDIAGNGGIYQYSLALEQEKTHFRIQHERLSFNEQPLFEFQIQAEGGVAQLYHDDHSRGPEYPCDWSRSGIAALQDRPDNQKLTWFKQRIARFFIVHFNPATMGSESRQEDMTPNWDMSNYAAWFRYLSQDQGIIFNLTNELRDILPGFKAFKIIPAGEAKILSVDFNQSGTQKAINYKFDELSDGQRVMMVLYTLIHCISDGEEYTLCIDEPENYLALPEIQPWLDRLYDQCQDNQTQALLISHHPKLINYLASHAGYWFSRQDNAHVRTQYVTDQESGLSIAELVARGWIYDD